MAVHCPSYNYGANMPSRYTYPNIKMEEDSDDERQMPRGSSSPAIPIATVTTANENWRGKNDPAERRRIQNRLNQRAFRQRQRAGESPKQYKSRSASAEDDESDDEDESVKSECDTAAGPSCSEVRFSTTGNGRPSGVTDSKTGHIWDELGQLISRNFMSAAVTNARSIGIDCAALQSGKAIKTPRYNNRQIPTALTPVELQYQVAHDPIIDTFPHARLRFNILRGIATGELDAAAFARSIRSSGGLENVSGNWQRGGVVVWSCPEAVASWELSESFVRRWCSLLQGCGELIEATNSWRGKRNERLFPLSLARSA